MMEEEKSAPEENVNDPHLVFVMTNGVQHVFQYENRAEALIQVRAALSQGFAEFENSETYLLVGGPKSGTGFVIMAKAAVEQQMAEKRAQAMQAALQQSNGQNRPSIVRP